MSAYGKSELEQSVADARTIAQSIIRLKHRVAANRELNALMPVLEARLERYLQEGRIPTLTADDIIAIAEGRK